MFRKKKQNLIIDETARIEKTVTLSARNNSVINIGKYTSLNGPNTFLMSYINDIVIGNYCSIAMGVKIIEYNHCISGLTTSRINKLAHADQFSDYDSKGSIEIANDVWIGMDSKILSGCKIATGCIVGANTVISKQFDEPYSIIVGNPARVVSKRFPDDIIKVLIESRWWEYSVEDLKNIDVLFKKKKFTLEDAIELKLSLPNK